MLREIQGSENSVLTSKWSNANAKNDNIVKNEQTPWRSRSCDQERHLLGVQTPSIAEENFAEIFFPKKSRKIFLGVHELPKLPHNDINDMEENGRGCTTTLTTDSSSTKKFCCDAIARTSVTSSFRSS